MKALGFGAIWTLDTEFRASPGERQQPLCLVAHELLSGRVVRIWLADGAAPVAPPFDLGPDSLFIAFFSSAEWGTFLTLGWDLPVHVLDLFVEFKLLTNGAPPPYGVSLLGALRYFGLPTMDAEEKVGMRALAMRGGPFTEAEKNDLVTYCEGDVRALDLLFAKMFPRIDMARALIRGRYMKAVARMEFVGIPIDVALYETLVTCWPEIRTGLISAAHEKYNVFPNGVFSRACFAEYLQKNDMSWPTTKAGHLALDHDTFKDMSRVYPEVEQLKQTLHSLGKLRLSDLAVGADGRNRTLLSPFAARTSRNQPSTTKYVFGLAAWLRNLIRPAPGRAIAYLDYEQQEFGIAAVLSNDAAMKEAYASGDPYLAFAKQAKAVPPDATKQSHKKERDRYKNCSLGVQYGMREHSLARRIEQSPAHARELLDAHRRTYPDYWKWSDAAVDFAMLHGWTETVFGWRQQVGVDANPRSLQNFPAQANGAEMLRLAAVFSTERGVNVGGPIHDALLAEAAIEEIDAKVATARQGMADASRVILGGFELRTDVKVIRWPDRYVDERGEKMWEVVGALLERLKP
jgi:hypothetical protein